MPSNSRPSQINEAAPTVLDKVVGQQSVVNQVRVGLEAAWADGRRFDHALLVGPPGLGKSSFCSIIARELGSELHEVLGQTIVSPSDLNTLLLTAKDKDVVLIDECHELTAEFQTSLYRAVEERKLFVSGDGFNQRLQSIPLADFTLLLATTDEFRLLQQAVASVNRSLVTLRRFFGWLVAEGIIQSNPGASVKELRRVQLAPKGLERAQVRRLLREIELRGDVRGAAIFSVFLYTGCRVSDLANLELGDLMISERSGTVVFRFGKGGKQRSCPLPLPARNALEAYLETRPPVESGRVFIGERGPITDRGVRALCDKYAAIVGVDLHPHLFRHTFAHEYLAANNNDAIALAQILGHESIQTTMRYGARTSVQLSEAAERLTY